MKAILEFNLEDNDDKVAHMRCIKSFDMALALWNITTNLKKKLENPCLGEEQDKGYFQALDTVFEKIGDELYDKGINIDDLIC